MTIDEEKRQQIEDFFLGLTTDERREQTCLRPEFRDAYNEITEAHRIFVLPQYYFKNWRHVLGPVAHALYEEMRRRTFYNPQTGERRGSFYSTQQELGAAIGAESILLLTNVAVARSRNSCSFVVRAYIKRWQVEETIRCISGIV